MKIFISDLDGTLIDNTLQSDDSVKKCAEKILDSKNDLVIATGRSLYGIQILNIYEYPIYFIIMNGAIILDRNKDIIYKKVIDEKIVNDIFIKYPSDNIEYITQGKTFMTISKEEYLSRYSKWDMWNKKMLNNGNGKQLNFMLSHFVFDADISKIKDQVVKINILEMDNQKYIEKTNYIRNFDEVINNPFDKNVLEITSKGITKKNAIVKLIQITKWNNNDIYVFGDGDNDSDMLEYFDNSFAPENASEKAKNCAKYKIGKCSSKSVINQIYRILGK